jgi:hypothetical protein
VGFAPHRWVIEEDLKILIINKSQQKILGFAVCPPRILGSGFPISEKSDSI